jgi:hypothetical protein
MSIRHPAPAALAAILFLGLTSGLATGPARAGGMCCALDVNVKMQEGARQEVDSSTLVAVSQFYLGLSAIERIDLAQLRAGRTGPFMTGPLEQASRNFSAAAQALQRVLAVAAQQRVPAEQTTSLRQLEQALVAIAQESARGALPNPNTVLAALRLSTGIIGQCGERAVLHHGMPGHLPVPNR